MTWAASLEERPQLSHTYMGLDKGASSGDEGDPSVSISVAPTDIFEILEAIASLDDSFFIIPKDVTMTREDLTSHLANIMDDPSMMRRLRRELANRISAQGSRLTDYPPE